MTHKTEKFSTLNNKNEGVVEDILLSEIHAKVRYIWEVRERSIASGYPEVAACFGTMVESIARIMEQTGSALSANYRLVIDTPERIFS